MRQDIEAMLKKVEEEEKHENKGNQIINFGSHRGTSYGELLKDDNYVRWVLHVQDPTGGLKEFRDFIVEEQKAGRRRTPCVSPTQLRCGSSSMGPSQPSTGHGHAFPAPSQLSPQSPRTPTKRGREHGIKQEEVQESHTKPRPSPTLSQLSQRKTLDDPNPQDLAARGKTPMGFSKYSGMTMAAVYDSDPDFAKWARDKDDPGPCLKLFQGYVKLRREAEEEAAGGKEEEDTSGEDTGTEVKISPRKHATGAKKYVKGTISCWKCHKSTPVYSWEGHIWMQNERPPPEPKPATVQLRFTKTAGISYWANTCTHCAAVQGENFIYKPVGPLPYSMRGGGDDGHGQCAVQ